MTPIALDETPKRRHSDIEETLRSHESDMLLALYRAGRTAAAQARAAGDMEAHFAYVRGLKLIQRIAGERGLAIDARTKTFVESDG